MQHSKIQRKRQTEQVTQTQLDSNVLEQMSGAQGQKPETQMQNMLEPKAGHSFENISVFAPDQAAKESSPPATDASSAAMNQMAAPATSPATGAQSIQRGGTTIPGGAAIESASADATTIIGKLRSLGWQAAGGFGGDADWESNASALVEGAIASNLNPRSVGSTWTETKGVNVNWTWRVTFHMGTPEKITGGGTGTSTMGTGGTGTVGTSSSSATTDSASVTAGGQSGPENSRVSASGTAGTSTTTTSGTSTTVAQNTAGSTAATTNQEHYRAPIIAECFVSPEVDISGSDYINPFKWGVAGVGAVGFERKSGDVTTGEVRYLMTNGIAPTPPAQRKGWVEQELGITNQMQENFARNANAQALNPNEMSRAGAQPIPTAFAGAAESHYDRSFQNVNLIQGLQADRYADSMNAAAFTVPNTQGGSDIFLHSSLDTNSAKGQHTLLHEMSHAVQNMEGQTSELSGLGGNEAKRAELENAADADASLILNQSQAKSAEASNAVIPPAAIAAASQGAAPAMLKKRS
jgi:hypothetical protein